MSLLEKLKAGSKNYKETVWPGTDHTIFLRILNADDYNNVTFETEKLYRNQEVVIGVGNIDDYNGERETRMLFYSITDPDTKQQIFKNVADLRKSLTPEIKDVLADELNSFHEECSPNPYEIDDDKFNGILNSLKKNAEKTISNVSNIHLLKKLIIYLVSPPKI